MYMKKKIVSADIIESIISDQSNTKLFCALCTLANPLTVQDNFTTVQSSKSLIHLTVFMVFLFQHHPQNLTHF